MSKERAGSGKRACKIDHFFPGQIRFFCLGFQCSGSKGTGAAEPTLFEWPRASDWIRKGRHGRVAAQVDAAGQTNRPEAVPLLGGRRSRYHSRRDAHRRHP